MQFKKVIIWGHKLHSHTHSYVHYGYKRAFEFLGYDTYWFDKDDDVSNFDFTNSLFFTEGQVDAGMPLLSDCFYITHNIENSSHDFTHIKNKLLIQVYNKDCINYRKINDYTHFDEEKVLLYQPWATDLLPYEIDVNIQLSKCDTCYYIGTLSPGGNDIYNIVKDFSQGCFEKDIKFMVIGGYSGDYTKHTFSTKSGRISNEEHISYIQKAYYAPAFQSEMQKCINYIPCRIFKNISYGQIGITNHEFINTIFDGKLIYDDNGYELFKKCELDGANQDVVSLRKCVKDNHTFINRINTILRVINEIR